MVDFYDRGRGVEVDPFLRPWRCRPTSGTVERLRRVGMTLRRVIRRTGGTSSVDRRPTV